MGTVLVNYSGKTRKATINGREYIVARCTLIVPGVLNGSKGALYYPPEEIAKNFDAWNGIPLTNGHPAVNGDNVSARNPSIIQSHGLGHVYNVNITKNGRLRGEAWFDVKSCERVRPEILNKLKSGEPIELSTGLFTNNVPANNGAHHNGRQYTHVARDYRPDHLAILMDQQGACSLRDGCGVLTDNGSEIDSSALVEVSKWLAKNGAMPGYGQVFVKGSEVWYVGGDGDEWTEKNLPIKKFSQVKGVSKVHYESEGFPPDRESWTWVNSKKPTTNCIFNESNVCLNCGGKGGKPGPCPTGDSGDDAASIKRQISEHKKDMKEKGIRVTSFMNGGLTADESRANAKLFDLKTKLEGAKKKGAGSATHVKDFLKTHDVTPEGFSAFGPQTKQAVVEKYNAANKTKLSVDDFHKLTTNNAACTLNASNVCLNCGGKGGKPGPCPTGKGQVSTSPPSTKVGAWVVRGNGSRGQISHVYPTSEVPATAEGRLVQVSYGNGNVNYREKALKFSKDQSSKLADKPTENSHSGDDMATKKEKMVQFLTTNCDCWKGEKDVEILSNFDEDKLKTLIAATKEAITNSAAINEIKEAFGAEAEGLTVNAMPAFVKGKALAKAPPEEMEDAEEEPAESEMEEVVAPPAKKGKKKMPVVANTSTARPEQPPTLNEWLASAPVEVQEVIRTAQAVEQGAKEKIVKTLVGNSSARTKDDRASLAKFLMAKPLAELNTLSKLSVNRAYAPTARDPMAFLEAPAKPAPTVNYAGLGEDFDDDEPTTNEDTVLDAPLGCPTANVDWAAEAKLIPTGARRNK